MAKEIGGGGKTPATLDQILAMLKKNQSGVAPYIPPVVKPYTPSYVAPVAKTYTPTYTATGATYAPQGVLKAEQQFVPPVGTYPPASKFWTPPAVSYTPPVPKSYVATDVPRGLAQSRWPWQYGAGGNIPLMRDALMEYPWFTKDAQSYLNSVPVRFMPPEASIGFYTTGPNQGYIGTQDTEFGVNPSTLAHEGLHSYAYAHNQQPVSYLESLPNVREESEKQFANYDDSHRTNSSEWYAQWPTTFGGWSPNLIPEALKPAYSGVIDYSQVPPLPWYYNRYMFYSPEENMLERRMMQGWEWPKGGYRPLPPGASPIFDLIRMQDPNWRPDWEQ